MHTSPVVEGGCGCRKEKESQSFLSFKVIFSFAGHSMLVGHLKLAARCTGKSLCAIWAKN